MNIDAERALLDLAQEIGRRDGAPSVAECERVLRACVSAIGGPRRLVLLVPLRDDLPAILRKLADRFERPPEPLTFARFEDFTVDRPGG